MGAPAETDPRYGPDPMRPRAYRVRTVRRETHDTFTLELEPANSVPEPGFAPGQFNMLYAFGVGEVPISISGDPRTTGPLLHTIRAVGKVTRALCDAEPGRVPRRARALRQRLAGAGRRGQRRGARRRRHRAGAAAAGALPRACPPRALRPGGPALRRPQARGTCSSAASWSAGAAASTWRSR